MEAFQLRMWDGRLGRWISPDPYGQYASPYLGMGNNPISLIDPDGGWSGDPGKGFWGNLWSSITNVFSKENVDYSIQLDEVVIAGSLKGNVSDSFLHSLSSNSIFFEQSSFIRNNFYKPNDKILYEAFKKGELSQFEYAVKRYNLQGETRAKLPQIGKAISELEMTRKDQMQKLYKYASGEIDTSVKAENTRNFGVKGALMTSASRAIIVVGVYNSVNNIHNAQNKGLAISQETGGWAGSLALSGEFAIIGSAFGPFGTIAGGIIGGAVGYYLGANAGEIIYNRF